MSLASIRRTLKKHNQLHLLTFWTRLDSRQREQLLAQLEAIDFDQLDEMIRKYVLSKPTVDLSGEIQPAPVIPARPEDEEGRRLRQQAIQRGTELIAKGKVAAFVVAGGQGTRLGYDGPKGCLQATPVARKSLFQLFAEQILAAGRRSERPVPWYIMTSPANDRATRDFFAAHGYFGLDEQDVFFLVQGTLPAVGLDGKVLLADVDSLALSPNGHGGSLTALRESGALKHMEKRGVEYVSYFQVDNPLVRCLDPLFVGLHDLQGSQMSAKVLPKRDPMEKLGNVCLLDGKVTVIEYSDMPDDLAHQTTEDGRLRFGAGSIAIHVLSRSFVEKLTRGGRCKLPLHRAEKKVPYVDESGKRVEPDAPNAVKLEMFVFDALPMAKKAVILETLRSAEFSPIKNASGPDSLTVSLHDQVRRAAAWLEAAGVKVPRDADGQIAAAIEISPLLADSAEELARKIDTHLTIKPGQSLYLE